MGDVTPISISFPDADDLHLRITVGACHLRIRSEEGENWVTGTYSDPSGALPVRVSQDEGTARIDQRPSVGRVLGLFRQGTPTLELRLGKKSPYSLIIESGAGDSDCDLGGLPLDRLTLRQGAVTSTVYWSSPNPRSMTMLELAAGAADVTMRNLANARAGVMSLQGGAASYSFDFGGQPDRDAEVRINTGMSIVTVLVPDTIAAKISSESFLGRMDVSDGFMTRGGGYWTPAAVKGETPVFRIQLSVGLGDIRLRTTGSMPAPLGNK